MDALHELHATCLITGGSSSALDSPPASPTGFTEQPGAECDLVGRFDGPPDASTNPGYLEAAILADHHRGKKNSR
jgi:hypothetical protein